MGSSWQTSLEGLPPYIPSLRMQGDDDVGEPTDGLTNFGGPDHKSSPLQTPVVGAGVRY